MINGRFKDAAAHIKSVNRGCSLAARGNPSVDQALDDDPLDAYEGPDRDSMEAHDALLRL